MSLRPPYALQRILHFDGFLKVVKWTKWQIEHLSFCIFSFYVQYRRMILFVSSLKKGKGP